MAKRASADGKSNRQGSSVVPRRKGKEGVAKHFLSPATPRAILVTMLLSPASPVQSWLTSLTMMPPAHSSTLSLQHPTLFMRKGRVSKLSSTTADACFKVKWFQKKKPLTPAGQILLTTEDPQPEAPPTRCQSLIGSLQSDTPDDRRSSTGDTCDSLPKPHRISAVQMILPQELSSHNQVNHYLALCSEYVWQDLSLAVSESRAD